MRALSAARAHATELDVAPAIIVGVGHEADQNVTVLLYDEPKSAQRAHVFVALNDSRLAHDWPPSWPPTAEPPARVAFRASSSAFLAAWNFSTASRDDPIKRRASTSLNATSSRTA